jgi:hypothetical protein
VVVRETRPSLQLASQDPALAGMAPIIVHNVMHGVELVISSVVEFSSSEILMQQEFVTLGRTANGLQWKSSK